MALGQVVDRLVTEYVLHDKYSGPAKNITASTATMKTALGSLSSRAGFGGGTAGIAAFGAALTVANAALTVFKANIGAIEQLWLGSKAFNMSQPFLEAAAAIDTMKRQLSAMLGSAKEGENALKWIQKYGLTSGMNDAPLQEAMRTILMSGRAPGRYLPMLESLSLMGGGDMNANMGEMSSIFRRLVGGQVADAFGQEGLGRFGVNRQMLGQYGAQFNKQGQFQGTVEDALAVLERMVALDPRIKDLKASMDSSLATRLSNLSNAFDIAKAKIGESIGNWLVPKLELLGTMLTRLARSGKLTEVMDKFLKMFGLGGDEGMAKGMVTLVVAAEMFIEKIGEMKSSLINAANTIIEIINAFGGGLVNVRKLAEGPMAGFKKELDKRVGELWAKMMNMPSENPAEPMPTGVNMLGEASSNAYLSQIADNTRKTADYQRMILGGGNMGAMGATAVELQGVRGRSPKWNKALQAFQEAALDDASMLMRGRQRMNAVMS